MGALVLAKPYEEQQSFSEFLDYVIAQEKNKDDPRYAEVRYAQTRKSKQTSFYVQLS